jgi:hypothetical protein
MALLTLVETIDNSTYQSFGTLDNQETEGRRQHPEGRRRVVWQGGGRAAESVRERQQTALPFAKHSRNDHETAGGSVRCTRASDGKRDAGIRQKVALSSIFRLSLDKRI